MFHTQVLSTRNNQQTQEANLSISCPSGGYKVLSNEGDTLAASNIRNNKRSSHIRICSVRQVSVCTTFTSANDIIDMTVLIHQCGWDIAHSLTEVWVAEDDN